MKFLSIRCIYLLMCISFTPYSVFAQIILTETDNSSLKTSNSKIDTTINDVWIVVSEKGNDAITFKIINQSVKNKLYFNKEYRDTFTALPGIVSISMFEDDPVMTVIIKKYYAEKYLLQQFDFCEDEVKSLFKSISE